MKYLFLITSGKIDILYEKEFKYYNFFNNHAMYDKNCINFNYGKFH